jgi:hypothetical protein
MEGQVMILTFLSPQTLGFRMGVGPAGTPLLIVKAGVPASALRTGHTIRCGT